MRPLIGISCGVFPRDEQLRPIFGISQSYALAVERAGGMPILVPPQPTTGVTGGGASFSVTPGGTPPFTYQWFKDGVAVAGANGAAYALAAVSSASAGSYTVMVTNAAGSVTSSAATLTVLISGALPTSLLVNLSVRTTLAAPPCSCTMSGRQPTKIIVNAR